MQLLDYHEPPMAHGSTHTGVGHAGPAQLPDAQLLQKAADVLNAGQKVAILVGAGAKDATDEVIAVADRLQAGAAKALLGKSVLPDDLPWVTGSLPARHRTQLEPHAGLRHAADGGIGLPLQRVHGERRCRSASIRFRMT